MIRGQITDVLFTEEQIVTRTKELAAQINKDYEGEEIYAICLLKGSLLFTSDLIRYLDVPVIVDMMRASSYEGTSTTSSGNVKILTDLDRDISDRNVLVIEDIVDTGRTLKKILTLLNARQPKTLRVCSLLDKPCHRVEEVPIDYRGFEIEDHFVVGYGLDFDDYYRNIPYVGILDPNA